MPNAHHPEQIESSKQSSGRRLVVRLSGLYLFRPIEERTLNFLDFYTRTQEPLYRRICTNKKSHRKRRYLGTLKRAGKANLQHAAIGGIRKMPQGHHGHGQISGQLRTCTSVLVRHTKTCFRGEASTRGCWRQNSWLGSSLSDPLWRCRTPMQLPASLSEDRLCLLFSYRERTMRSSRPTTMS